jgi:GT2 family glycosyltransferase/predicted ATP-grasp superfamily ATP-dependent carboligase
MKRQHARRAVGDPTESRPPVSVVICTFSEERWQLLAEAVESVRRQNQPPIELIVVVDHNRPLLERARDAFSDARVIENTGASGLSAARNAGWRAAEGAIVAFLDDDAVADPHWLRRLTAAYHDPGVVGVGGAVEPRWEGGRPRTFPPEFQWVVGCSYEGVPTRTSPVRNPIGANMSFRRDALALAGGFRSGLGRLGRLPEGCEETELCIRAARTIPGSAVLYEPAAGVHHFVPAERARWRYFAARCLAEGVSKARVARAAGRSDALSSEWTYVVRTLPRGVLRGMLDAARGEAAGAARAAWIVAGLAFTTSGYVFGMLGRSGRRVEDLEVVGVDAPRVATGVPDGPVRRDSAACEPERALVGTAVAEDRGAMLIGAPEPGPAFVPRADAHETPEASAPLEAPDQFPQGHRRAGFYRRMRRVSLPPRSFDALILEGYTRGSVAVARSLGAAGHSLAVAAGRLSTRHASERVRLADPHLDFDAFVSDLLVWIHTHPVRAVLTSGEVGVIALSRIRDVIEPRTRVGIPAPAATSLAMSKDRTLALASELEVPVPRFRRVVDRDGVVEAARAIGYPCVLKPEMSWQDDEAGPGGRRVISAYLRGESEARAAAEALASPRHPALLQEYAPGRREAIALLRHRGRIHARFAMATSRCWPPMGGNSVMRTSIEPPTDTLAHAEALMHSAGIDGYAEVEFRRSGDGRPLLMEINPRFSQSVELAVRSGVDFPRMQLAATLDEPLPPAPGRYREGVRLSWLGGELWTLANAALAMHDPHPPLREALVALGRDYRRPPHLDGLDPRDPPPMIRSSAAMCRELANAARTHLADSRPGLRRRVRRAK